MDKPKLYRKRFIPNEMVYLKDDEIVYMDNFIMITKWKVLKPRKDFTHGCSCFFLKEGFKISKFYDSGENCVYTYCDIIETIYSEKDNSYIFNDLLVDVIVLNTGEVKVLDLAELTEALDKKLISVDTAKKALVLVDKLLSIIYEGKFLDYTKHLEAYA